VTSELERFMRAVPLVSGPLPARLEGRYLRFERSGFSAHEPSYAVISRRGGFGMGSVEWSPQWRGWMFRPHGDGLYPLSALAEVYAFLKGLGGRQI
jgi:hypothetical protein